MEGGIRDPLGLRLDCVPRRWLPSSEDSVRPRPPSSPNDGQVVDEHVGGDACLRERRRHHPQSPQFYSESGLVEARPGEVEPALPA